MPSAGEGSQAKAGVSSKADSTAAGPILQVSKISSVQRGLVKLSAQRSFLNKACRTAAASKRGDKVSQSDLENIRAGKLDISKDVVVDKVSPSDLENIRANDLDIYLAEEKAKSSGSQKVGSNEAETAKDFSLEVDNPPVCLFSENDIPQLKVMAAWKFREIPRPKDSDVLRLQAQLGDWYPPPPPPGEFLRFLRSPHGWTTLSGLTRRGRRKAMSEWGKKVKSYFEKQSQWGEKLKEEKLRLSKLPRTSPRAVLGKLEEPKGAVYSVRADPLSRERLIAKNAEILSKKQNATALVKRKDRRLIVSSPNPVLLAGSIQMYHQGEMGDSVPRYKSMCGSALCYLKSPSNQSLVKVRALLDSGAEVTLVEKFSAKRAGISGRDTSLTIGVAGGGHTNQQLREIAFQLVSMDKSYCSPPMMGLAADRVAIPSQPVLFNPKQHDYLKDLTLVEKFPNHEMRPINLLVGEPYFSALMENEVRSPKDLSLPKAVKTKLGWILRGATGLHAQVPVASVCSAKALDNEIFDLETMQKSMGFDFRKFWTGENVGLSPHESMHSDLTALEVRANDFHAATARFNPAKKRWSVHLPWIEEGLEAHRLSDNLSRAIAFYHSAMAKVKPEQMPYVVSAYEELMEKGFVEQVPDDELETEHPNYVMTSRPVFRMDKATTKCRIVINASLPDHKNKERPGNTLNKMLMPGPNKLPQIMELVLKLMFLEHVFLIDVKKMFLSVDLALTSDKDMLRYVWAKPGEKIKVYRHKTLAFGVISSPFQAMSCLHDTAKLLETDYPEAAEAIQTNTYMDDNSGGSNDLGSAKKLLDDILIVMESGGFIGHKIAVSHPDLSNGIPEDRLDKSRVISVLGLKLDLDSSEFMFNMDEKFAQFDANADCITRRDIVAVASMIFDTQGFVSPYIMQYKKLLPLLWHNNTKWDENLVNKVDKATKQPDMVAAQAVKGFREWIADVDRLKQLKFPRHIVGKLEGIAIFGDASKTGIGCVAYAIKKQPEGSRKAHIIYSKSTLMPKNLRGKAELEDALTIARAELIALLCCMEMSEYIRNALKPAVTSDMVHVFTDSLLNLQRVQRGLGKSKPWEERRVRKILERKDKSTISFCPGVLNPADLPSRGCNLEDLTNRFEFWSQGPEFLRLPKDQWPKQPSPAEKIADENTESAGTNLADSDVKLYLTQIQRLVQSDIDERNVYAAQVLAAQSTAKPEESFLASLLERFASPRKTRRVLAYVLRFIKKVRKQAKDLDEPTASKEVLPALPNYKCGMRISAKEVREADIILVREAQRIHFPDEMKALQEAQERDDQDKKPTTWKVKFGNNSPLKHLAVYYDPKDKLIRLRTRLHLSSTVPFDTTNPIILPKSKWGERLLLEIHQDRYHCSQRQTFNELRQRFWMIGGFSYVKQQVRKLCLTPRCRFRQYECPKMSPLPEIRMDKSEAWKHVGVDYVGPITVKHDCKEKNYGQQKCDTHDKHKVWGAVFTCMTSRSVNVELIKSCTTVDFLGAFRRHVADHGRPDTFYSDQAKNFTAADKQLRQVLIRSKEEIRNFTYAQSYPINWRYSSPTAPWANGCTERLVGIFKKQLQIALQKVPLTYDQLQTISKEICSCVNDRPLGVTEQGSDDIQITPNMLVRGRPNTPLQTTSDHELSKLPYADQWIRRKRELKSFWDRWQSEYLATLSVDSKWAKGHSSVIKPGDVVTLKPETLGKNQWRIARVMEVHKNLDGLITTATVKLPNGSVLKRTLRQLALLEASFEDLGKLGQVTEERPVISISQDEVLGDTNEPVPSGSGHDGPGAIIVGEQKADAKYPGEEEVTSSKPELATLESLQDPRGLEETGERRGKRARKDPGYYTKLAKGNYSCQNIPEMDEAESSLL